MANHYTDFSTIFEVDPDQAQKAKDLFDRLIKAEEDQTELDGDHPELSAKITDGESVGFVIELHPQDDRVAVLVTTETNGYGNEQMAATYISDVLQICDIDEAVDFEFAFTAQKGIPGAFGGGAALIERDNIEWMGTSLWLQQQRERRAAEKATPKM